MLKYDNNIGEGQPKCGQYNQKNMLTETLASGGLQSRWIPLCPNYYKYLLLHESRHVVVSHCTETCMNIILYEYNYWNNAITTTTENEGQGLIKALHLVDMKLNNFTGNYLFKF